MWSDLGFSEETTSDGSPTLRLQGVHQGLDEGPGKRPDKGPNNGPNNGDKPPESMHHSGGAAAETEHIYRPIGRGLFSQKLISLGFSPRFLSVGLGLGYIEMMIARESLIAGGPQLESLLSFESVPALRQNLLGWIAEDVSLSEEIVRTYDRVAHHILKNSTWTTLHLKNRMRDWYEQGRWRLQAKIEDAQKGDEFFCGIFYDAFSAKTDGHLWNEEFLNQFLLDFAAPQCLLSTYACLGTLKRALKQQNFQFIKRAGFQGKRNSTFAYRGIPLRSDGVPVDVLDRVSEFANVLDDYAFGLHGQG